MRESLSNLTPYVISMDGISLYPLVENVIVVLTSFFRYRKSHYNEEPIERLNLLEQYEKGNHKLIQALNRSKVLNKIRTEGPISRIELAKK